MRTLWRRLDGVRRVHHLLGLVGSLRAHDRLSSNQHNAPGSACRLSAELAQPTDSTREGEIEEQATEGEGMKRHDGMRDTDEEARGRLTKDQSMD